MISDPMSLVDCDGPGCTESLEVLIDGEPEPDIDTALEREGWVGDFYSDHQFCCKECEEDFENDSSAR